MCHHWADRQCCKVNIDLQFVAQAAKPSDCFLLCTFAELDLSSFTESSRHYELNVLHELQAQALELDQL